MRTLMQDLQYALRQCRKSPGSFLTAILSLALGIGATTAVFSVVHGVLLDPYPYKDADRMVHVELRDETPRGPLLMAAGAEYEELRQAAAVDDVFLMQDHTETLTGTRMPISVSAGHYSPNLFTYMGVPPLLGREFTSEDASGASASPVAVLSYLFWKRQFGGSRDVIGKSIELDHTLYTVIGVAPPRFTWGDSDVYIPQVPSADPHDYSMAFLKLKPHTNFTAAAAELQILVDDFAKRDPQNFPQHRRVAIVTLNEEVLGRFAGTLVLLFGSVIALLVIGCFNVSILLLARGAARQHELAVRVSVGASRMRLIRQLLTESVLLSFIGAGLGVMAAYFGVAAISAMLPQYSFPHEAAIRVNAIVLAFSAAVAVMTGILFGLSPAWQLSRPQVAQLIQANSTKLAGSVRGRNVHRALIAGQVALTLLLLAGAGAATRAFLALTHTPLGFDPNRVIAFDLTLPKGANPTWQQRLNEFETMRKTIEQTPGIASASVSEAWFPGFHGFLAPIEVESKPTMTGAQAVLALVSPQELSTLRIPLLAGRFIDDAEVMRGAHLAVVNQAFVKQYFADREPIGQSVRSAMLKVGQPSFVLADQPDAWLEVIGVIGDARNDGLDHPVKPSIFLPYSFVLPPDEEVLVRTTGDAETAKRAVEERLHKLNGEIGIAEDHTLMWSLDTQGWGRERFIATLFSLFAALALVLAATGLYSVVSYAVTQRTQELGIRMALGAPRGNIVRLVLKSTAIALGGGIAIGVVLSVALNRVVVSWAGGSSRDPLTLLAVVLVLALVATLACILPARRAASIDPMQALRLE
ncbi:MAG: ABC transporter permease [Candidatus Acidiferrales bacterium]|jgi:predicted permease